MRLNNRNLILIAGIGVVGYLLYRRYVARPSPQSALAMGQNAGNMVRNAMNTANAALAAARSSTGAVPSFLTTAYQQTVQKEQSGIDPNTQGVIDAAANMPLNIAGY